MLQLQIAARTPAPPPPPPSSPALLGLISRRYDAMMILGDAIYARQRKSCRAEVIFASLFEKISHALVVTCVIEEITEAAVMTAGERFCTPRRVSISSKIFDQVELIFNKVAAAAHIYFSTPLAIIIRHFDALRSRVSRHHAANSDSAA